MEKELNRQIDRLETLVADQEALFRTMFLAGFHSAEKEPHKAWLKYIKEESDYQIENI